MTPRGDRTLTERMELMEQTAERALREAEAAAREARGYADWLKAVEERFVREVDHLREDFKRECDALRNDVRAMIPAKLQVNGTLRAAVISGFFLVVCAVIAAAATIVTNHG